MSGARPVRRVKSRTRSRCRCSTTLPNADKARFRILASDLSTKVLRIAEQGVYKMERVEGIPIETLRRHFERGMGAQEGLARVNGTLRQRVEFRQLNLLEIGSLDRTFACDLLPQRDDLFRSPGAAARRVDARAASAPWRLLVHLPFRKPEWGDARLAVGSPRDLPAENLVIGSRSRLPNSGLDAPPRPDLFGKSASGAGAGQKHVVGIGELAVSSGAADQIVTHALGSCIAVCLWDPVSNVAGLLHYLLPESKINPQRAVTQPATYADTGIPLLLEKAFAMGAHQVAHRRPPGRRRRSRGRRRGVQRREAQSARGAESAVETRRDDPRRVHGRIDGANGAHGRGSRTDPRDVGVGAAAGVLRG